MGRKIAPCFTESNMIKIITCIWTASSERFSFCYCNQSPTLFTQVCPQFSGTAFNSRCMLVFLICENTWDWKPRTFPITHNVKQIQKEISFPFTHFTKVPQLCENHCSLNSRVYLSRGRISEFLGINCFFLIVSGNKAGPFAGLGKGLALFHSLGGLGYQPVGWQPQ